MSIKGYIISLAPLFEEFLSNGELKDICGNLYRNRILTSDLAKKNCSLSQALTAALTSSKEKKWKQALVQEIKNCGKEKLAVVVRSYLLENNNKLMWVVTKWYDLVQSKHTFDGLEWLLHDIKIRRSNQLLDVAFDCTQSENDSNIHNLIVEQMKSNLQKHLPQKSSKSYTKHFVDPNLLRNIEPMLSCELSIQQILTISSILCEEKIIPKDIVKKIEKLYSSCQPGCESKAINHIADGIYKTKTSGWESVLRLSVNNEAGILIAHALDACFNHPEAIAFRWMAICWKGLKTKHDLVCSAYETFFHTSSRFSKGPEWLLKITHKMLTENPENVQKFVKYLSVNLNQMEAALESPSLQQASMHSIPNTQQSFIPTTFGESAYPVINPNSMQQYSPQHQQQAMAAMLSLFNQMQSQAQFQPSFGNLPALSPVHQFQNLFQSQSLVRPPLAPQGFYQEQHHQMASMTPAASVTPMDVDDCRINMEGTDADTTIGPPSAFVFHDETFKLERGFDELSKERSSETLESSTTPSAKQVDILKQDEKNANKGQTSKNDDMTSGTSKVTGKSDKIHQKKETNEAQLNQPHPSSRKETNANKQKDGATNDESPKENREMETKKGPDHGHMLRSRGKEEIKVCENMTCMEPYKCKNLGLIQSPEPKSEEMIVEIRVIVDGGLKKSNGLFVYVDNLKEQFPLHEDDERSQCFHTFVCVSKHLSELTYKFLTKTDDKDYWEAVPRNAWDSKSKIVNRKRKLRSYDEKRNYILFDVCKILTESETIPLGDFNSLYAKHMQTHLPAFETMQLPANNKSFKQYYEHIDQWWTSAFFGISFSAKSSYEATCNEKLRKYLEDIPKVTTSLNLLAVHLALCSVICKFQITPPHSDKEFWKKLRSGLNISKLSNDDYKNIYEAVQICEEENSSILNGVLHILKNTDESPNCLLLIPLIYILMNNGDHTYCENTWKQVISKAMLLSLMHKLKKATPSKKLHKKVKQLAPNFPDIPKLYQEIFSLESICKLLSEDAEFLDLFDGTKLFRLAKSTFDQNDNHLILANNPSVTDWIYKSLKTKISDTLDDVNKIDKIRTDIQSMFTQVCIKSNGSKNLTLLVWSLTLVFLLPQDKEDFKYIFRKIKEAWIEKDTEKQLHSRKIQILNNLVDLKVNDEVTAELWKKEVKSLLKTFFLEKMKSDTSFIQNFDNTSQLEVEPNSVVNFCFHEAIVTYIEQAQNKSWFQGITDTLTNNSGVLGIIEEKFSKHWATAHGNVIDKVLHLLHQQVAFSYFRFAGNGEQAKRSKSQKALSQCKMGLSLALEMFKTGSISVKNLMEIIQSEETFIVAVSVLNQDSNVDKENKEDEDILRTLFQTRESELATLQKFQETNKHFVNMCQSAAQGSFQDDWLLNDITNLKWCDVIKCYDGSDEESDPDHPPEIALFGLTSDQHQAIQEIHEAKLDKNETIWSYWTNLYNEALTEKKTATENNDIQLSIDDVIEGVWKKIAAEFCPLKQRLTDGTILLCEVESLFKSCSSQTSVTQLLEAILRFPTRVVANNSSKDPTALAPTDNQNIKKRSNQICNYFSLKKQQKNLSNFVAFKDSLKLEGDFDILEIIEDEGILSGEKALNSITVSVMKAGSSLEGVSQEKCVLLESFLEKGELIEWLQIMKDRSEVKVMSDLAMISAGESVQDVDRVSCFLSAVMGFAPFIFDLKNDSGFKEVIEAVEKVWEQKERDPELLTKWKATALSLEWLKGIKDFHGSVEKSSLLKAQNINANGMYIIGGGGKKPTVATSVKLKFVSKTDEMDANEMTLTDLQDLQSRLMLIEDKGLSDVQLFIDTLSHVENLALAYVALKVAGCLLFKDWTVQIKNECENDDKPSMIIRISFDANSPPIVCRENAVGELQDLILVMKNTLASWRENLSAKRSEFYHLNHFNIQQITYLCHQLANASGNKYLPDQVYTLMSVIKHNIAHDDVLKCLGDVTTKEENGVPEEETVDSEEPEELSELEQKRKLFHELINDDVSPSVAKAGVHQATNLDYDEVFMWCLDNETEDDLIREYAAHFDSDIGLADLNISVGVVESVVKDKSTLSILEVIHKLLEEESKNHRPSVCVNTICKRYMEEESKTSLADCISLDHLGKFLNSISSMVNPSTLPNRKVPTALVESVNLVTCPEADTFTTLVSIYMNSPEQPLPTASEVLLCTNDTTQNDVSLLLHRAVAENGMKGKGIYCLVHTEKLDFEVANSVQTTLTQLKKENCNEFKLVIMCSDQRHFIASLFHEQKVDYSERHSPEEIQLYLKEKLNIDDQTTNGHPTALFITCHKAGLGKSLYISRMKEKLAGDCHRTTVRFLEKDCKPDMVLESILDSKARNTDPHFVHLDITPSVQNGINYFLFNLVILGSFEDSLGFLWRKHNSHVYCIEYTCMQKVDVLDQLLLLLPRVTCLSPKQIIEGELAKNEATVGMDQQEFASETFQRPYQYLKRHKQNLDNFSYTQTVIDAVTGKEKDESNPPEGNPEELLETLLHHCSVKDPSWSETRHFASFLNCQLRDCEKSVFCNVQLMGHDSGLTGFKNFVVKFMIRMSQDFATPSLDDVSQGRGQGKDVFEQHQLRRSWEQSNHPYLFFNEDRMSMTFLNFKINPNGDLLASKTNQLIEQRIMDKKLVRGLELQRVDLQQNFDNFSRHKKLETLYQVFGIKGIVKDPDPTYELTTDNVVKMLAIHMRFRCDIPVIIMGETGCGKTRMVEFMSKLKSTGVNSADCKPEDMIRNMVIVKVHGGITVTHIQKKVSEASDLAEENKDKTDTLLFLDEANTTEGIYAIKEFVCDGSICGKAIKKSSLNIVAACNPYRKHSPEAIKRMENAGLGFKVKTDDTTDKLGEIPMRCLVYRVIALPPSMHPLVWDFGQLKNVAEKVYIEQMVDHESIRQCVSSQSERNLIVHVLTSSQAYMRENRQECLFVSLRDVERCLVSFKWFFHNRQWLFDLDKVTRDTSTHQQPTVAVKSLIQAVGMCYHVTLSERTDYRQMLSNCLANFQITMTESEIEQEITACQSVFLEAITLGDDIASNEALRENVFMIVMCTEMRIPLFLIGKPGSSKSLAKTIVTDAMQGSNSNNEVFQKLKQIHVLSFQCSPVTDAVGIESVFKQCASLQEKQDVTKFVAVVVLDEIGLAEDSPKMPLKVLHPLLESGVTNSELTTYDSRQNESQTQKRVGFVGISNWALDPAKMNRGLFVHRGAPTKDDLKLTARGIFSSETTQYDEVSKIVDAVTTSYLQIEEERMQRHNETGGELNLCDREFFGLRDYYGLLKMIYAVFCDDKTTPHFFDVFYAVQRNFNGAKFDCMDIFIKNFAPIWPDEKIPEVTLETMIQDNLRLQDEEDTHFCETRYLLLMTNHLAAVDLLGNITETQKFEVVFGSSFPQDNNYTEKCRNINRIKMCMEAGNTVLLLNLKDLYESLYDALNQHYVTFAGQRYVDLGLGGHRVKCRVHKEFRLIVMENQNVVYDEFPIPLINRLEKHIFTTRSLLNPQQKTDAQRLEKWVGEFSHITQSRNKEEVKFTEQDSFVGYMDDTAGSAVMTAGKGTKTYESAQTLLLNTATCDSVLRLESSGLWKEAQKWQKKYFDSQHHDNLFSLLKSCCEAHWETGILLIDVTSFSHILSQTDQRILEKSLDLQKYAIMLITLQQFKTADEFSEKIRNFITKIKSTKPMDDEVRTFILLIQCPQAHTPLNLTACAKYAVTNVLQNQEEELKSHYARLIVAFLFTVERHSTHDARNQVKSYISAKWTNVYVDELRVTTDYLGPPSKIRNMSLGDLFAFGAQVKLHEYPGQKTSTNFANPDFLIDLHHLLCHSLSLAITKLKPDFPSADVSRYGNLFAAFSTDDIFCREFVNLIKQNIVDLANEREGQGSNWISNLAASSMSLQEGGSFTKTLWLYLKKIASTMLAYIISEIDEDQNLNILWGPLTSNSNRHLKQVWIKMFMEKMIFGLSWDNYDKVQQFVVKGSENFVCQFPFSRKLLRHFQKHWELLQHQQNASEHFHTILKGTKLNGLLEYTFETEATQVLKCFVHDLVHLYYKCGSGEPLEYQFIADALISIYGQKQWDLDDDITNKSNLPALLFVLMTQFSQQLNQVGIILKVFPSILKKDNVAMWLNKQNGKTKPTIQLEVFSAALDLIKQKSDELKTVENYHDWASLIREIGPVAESILKNPETETQRKTWKALAFGALFLEQLVPAGLNEEAYRGYIEVLLPSSKRLWKGALKVGLNNEKYLNTLVKNLNGSVNKIRVMCLLDWQDIVCKQCKRATVVDPVVLPCKHFMCLKCTEFLLMDRCCPTCRAEIPQDFEFQPSVFSPEQKSDMDVLSGNCTSFFLEYLSTLCFPAPGSMAIQADAKKHVTDALHNLVIQDKATRKLSPLQSSALDDTPTVRSFILQLLLRYDRNEIQEELESHFTTVGRVLESKQDLMMVYIRCIEDSLHQQVENISMPHLLQEQIVKVQNEDFNGQLQHLDVVANLRYILQTVIAQMYQELVNGEEDQSLYNNIQNLSELASENLKAFVTKSFCRRYGIGMFPQLMEHEHFQKVIPQYLLTDYDDQLLNQTSLLIVAGKAVETTKQKLNEIMHDDNPDSLDAIFTEVNQQSAVQVILGTLLWSGIESETVGNKIKLSTCGSILDSMQQKAFISNKVYNASNGLRHHLSTVRTEGQFMDNIISELFMSAVMATASCSDNLLLPLHDLQIDQNVSTKFLPTMTESSYFKVKSFVQTWLSDYNKQPPKMYVCPNNHPYLVGDCTKVVYTGTLCPECKLPIGGVKGKRDGDLMPGNRAGELTEESQAGYKLPQPEDRGEQSAPERQCNKLSVCVIRFLLHSNLLVNVENSDVQRMFGVSGITEAKQMLVSHLQKDLQQLANSMGKSVEDSALLLHQIFKQISQSEEQNNCLDVGFSSMKSRENWETEFQRCYLTPIFAKADRMINEARNLVLDAKKQSDLEKLVFEIPNGETQEDEVVADIVSWNHPSLWQYHINITLEHLRQTLSGTVTSKSDEGAVLQLILESHNLPILSHLKLILEIQTALVERYRQRVDVNDVNTITIESYLESSDCIIHKDKFNAYINLWNEVRHQLKMEIGSHLPSEYFEQDLHFRSPVSMFLPSPVDRGQCALLFTQYVIQQQNKLLLECAEMMNPRPKFEEVKISELSSSDIVSIKNEQIFLPYILANAQYEATMTPSGSKHEIVYRIPALEKQILQRYIMHKKLIDRTSVPCVEFLQDTGMAKEFLMLQKNVKQEKLSVKLVQKLEDLKGTTTMPAICEAVRTLTLVVKYLSKMKSDEKMDLNTYIRKDLMLSPEEAELIPNSSKLCHTRALFEWFAWQRSIKYSQLEQDPFRNIVKPENQELIPNEVSVKDFLSQINIEELQIEINSLLIMKDDLNVESGLKYYLEPFADDRNMEFNWIDQLPEEILVKHAVDLFKNSAQFM